MGFGGGLYIAALFDPEDWTVGPYYHTEGFRVLLHEPGTTVYTLAESGIPVQPGVETTFRVERTVTSAQVMLCTDKKCLVLFMWIGRSLL